MRPLGASAVRSALMRSACERPAGRWADRDLAMGRVGACARIRCGGCVSEQEQQKMDSDLRHPLDARLIALSEQLANGVVTATAADLVMEARDAIAKMNMQVMMACPVVLVQGDRLGELAREDFERIDAGMVVPLDPKADLRVHCPACVNASGQDEAAQAGEGEEGGSV